MKKCVFAGTFDPLTKGHEFVIEKCVDIFDKVIVAVGVNTEKKPKFTLEERVEMIKNTFANNLKIEVVAFEGMLVNFMRSNGISVNVRGVRNVDDYKYELNMERFNHDMLEGLTTLFIPTPKELVHVSSTAIRTIIDLNGNIEAYVPKAVAEYVNSKK